MSVRFSHNPINTDMKKNQNIELKKLKPCDKPLYPTPGTEDYTAGKYNGDVSLPIDYTVKGRLASDIEVGKSIMLERYERNGVKVLGWFSSSTVTKIEGNNVYTKNSVYSVKEI
jgi:hypothetical protein